MVPRKRAPLDKDLRQALPYLLAFRSRSTKTYNPLMGLPPLPRLDICLPKDCLKKIRDDLSKLSQLGCDSKLILACARILAEPPKNIRVEAPDYDSMAKDALKAADLIRQIFERNVSMHSVLNITEWQVLQAAPRLLTKYHDWVNRIAPDLKSLFRSNLVRKTTATTVVGHVFEKTRKHHYGTISELVNAFGKDEIDADALRKLYKRKKTV